MYNHRYRYTEILTLHNASNQTMPPHYEYLKFTKTTPILSYCPISLPVASTIYIKVPD